jgi:hypothetical protein
MHTKVDVGVAKQIGKYSDALPAPLVLPSRL